VYGAVCLCVESAIMDVVAVWDPVILSAGMPESLYFLLCDHI
jgi:hypothetical protein